MRPLHLTLRNFIGIRSGQGREEIRVDLSTLSGLVAITGPNGTGKTTVLDNAHPYRLMPYRAGGYTERSFSYYDETIGEARKILDWEHGNQKYRSDIFIKGATKSKKTEAYLFVQAGGDWEPMKLPDGTVSDGKVDVYDRCVRHILGGPEMFFTAAFAAQGRKCLSDYAPGEMKLLLSELLGLDELLALSAAADDAAKHLAAQFEGLQAAMQAAGVAEAQAADLDRGISSATKEHEALTAERAERRALAATASTELAEARARQANLDEVRVRADRLKAEIRQLEQDRDARLRHLEQQIREARTRGAATAIVADIQAIERRLATARAQRSRHEQVIAAAPGLEAAQAAAAALEEELATLTEEQRTEDQKLPALRESERALYKAREEAERHKGDGRTYRTQIDAAKRRAELATKVPCAGTEMNARCALLNDAHAASNDLIKLEQAFVAAKDGYAKATADIAELEPCLARITQTTTACLSLTGRITQKRVELEKARTDQAAVGRAEQARQAIADLDQQISEATEQLEAKRRDKATAEREAADAARDLQAEQEDVRRSYAARLSSAQLDLSQLPPIDQGENLAQAEQRAEQAERNLANCETRLTECTNRFANLRAQRAALSERLREAERLRAQTTELSDDIAQWRLLAKGLGPDGVVALSIDDAGPTISELANDLLVACYGPRFSLRFDTQAAKRDGSLKETFDIRVFDAERGDDKSLSKTSGGERIWINEALTRAIGLFRAQQSGQSYGCLFSDESDGALDADRKQQFVRMKRRVLELGGYHTEYFVSHAPELWGLADHRLDLTP